jgi:formylglycine-generating enzyme required for sulfatase activity
MNAKSDWLLDSHGTEGDAAEFFRLGRELESRGDRHLAATAYDRAFGLQPGAGDIAKARKALLDTLTVEEHGILFRYIPGGSFLMGTESGEPDEQPVHRVRLHHYWLSETPISWATYCRIMEWEPPPYGVPREDGHHYQGAGKLTGQQGFSLRELNKIRLQYSEDGTTRAGGWHFHTPEARGKRLPWQGVPNPFFGKEAPDDPQRPWGYEQKPMVSVSWQEAEELCSRISADTIRILLPSEAEWEKAARGALIGCRYPWGNEPASDRRCDFGRFDRFSVLPMRQFAPNSYGLYAMSGCVWEWTADWYDAESYHLSEELDPGGPAEGQARVLRGGSWADCPEAVTVSFRMSHLAAHWRDKPFGGCFTPNVGFRICRVEEDSGETARS